MHTFVKAIGMNDSIVRQGDNPGATLAIFCGTHGNEQAGVIAMKRVLETVHITAGTVYFVYANPRAIAKHVRLTEKNLNRCFVSGQYGSAYEEVRARELMALLDTCDALLDVHASNNPHTTPFVITNNGFEVAAHMNFDIVTTGFDDVEPGATDGYMYRQGKVGVCIECGYTGSSDAYADLAYTSILQFLQFYGSIEHTVPFARPAQRRLHVDGVQVVTPHNFQLSRSFADFETLPAGTVIATDDHTTYQVDTERVIIFGTPGKAIGAEAYVLGTWVSE